MRNNSVRNMVQVLRKSQEERKPLGIMALGNTILVYDGLNTIYKFKCSSAREALKTADRIQDAYDKHAIPVEDIAI